MKFQAFLRVLTAGALSLLLLALGGAIWLRAQIAQTAQGIGAGPPLETLTPQSRPKSIAFVPNRTIALGSVLVDLTDWEAAQIAAVPLNQQRALRRRLGAFKRQLRRFGIRYNQDIRPWIGSEVAAALVSLDEDRNADNGAQPGYLLAIATDDPQASRAFLQRLWRGRSAQTTRQAGVEITYAASEAASDTTSETLPNRAPLPGLSTAHVGRQFVLIASHLSVLQDAISSAQVPSLNIQSRQRYEAALPQLFPESISPERIGSEYISPKRIGFVLAELPQLRSWLAPDVMALIRQRITGRDWTAQHDTLLAAVTQADRDLALQLWLTSLEALSLDAASAPVKLNSPELETPQEEVPLAETPPQPFAADRAVARAAIDRAAVDRALAEWLPSTSAAAILDRDLSARWPSLAGEDSPPLVASALAAIAPPDLAALGVDVQDIRDWVVPWVDSSYGIAKLARPDDAKTDAAEPDWLFVTPTAPAVEDGLRQLDAQAQAQGLTVGTISYAGHPLTVWTKLSVGIPPNEPDGDLPSLIAEVKGAHTVVEDTALVATSARAIALALQTTAADAISRAIATLGPSDQGYLHLSWPEVRALAQQSRTAKGASLFELLDGLIESVTLTRYGEGQTPNAESRAAESQVAESRAAENNNGAANRESSAVSSERIGVFINVEGY